MEKYFSLNRSLCDIKFNKNLKDIDVDVIEYVWFKIRESFLSQKNSPSFTIEFSELSKMIGKYKSNNRSLIDAIQRLKLLRFTTNVKSNLFAENLSIRFRLFNHNDKPKGFIVELDEDIYPLFDKPKCYNEYHQHCIHQLHTKYSKLFYKFIIGYRYLKQKSFFVTSDVLRDILNIHTDKNESYVKTNIIDKAIADITQKTDISFSIDKVGYEYKGEKKVVKYKITIKAYRHTVQPTNRANAESLVNEYIEYIKEEGMKLLDTQTAKIPFVGLVYTLNDTSERLLFIDDNYRLSDGLNFYTKNAEDTKDFLESFPNGLAIEIDYMEGYPKNFSKMCLLTPKQLNHRGLI